MQPKFQGKMDLKLFTDVGHFKVAALGLFFDNKKVSELW